MLMDPKNQRAYVGHSGQMAVMAELLSRGCNVATPEIDVGEDLFAFLDGQSMLDRIQVKTVTAKRLKEQGCYSADVSVPLAQLRALDQPRLYFVFPVRLEGMWTDFVVISRRDLNTLSHSENLGYSNQKSGELQLHLTFGPASLVCSGKDLHGVRNAWQRL